MLIKNSEIGFTPAREGRDCPSVAQSGRAGAFEASGRVFKSLRGDHYVFVQDARVAELVDALDSESSGATRESSSLSPGTIKQKQNAATSSNTHSPCGAVW